MCLIIDRPTATTISDDLLWFGMTDNPHGWGIMRAAGGKIQVQRGMDEADFWPAYKRVGKAPCAIHFRFATHGTKDLDNCHPFPLYGGHYALMHNGIIDMPVIDKSRSDTWHFGHYVLEPMLAARPELFGSEELTRVLASLIGPGNKLVILRADGASMVVNRSDGIDHEGLWLSNAHSLPTHKVVSKWPDGTKTDWYWDRIKGRSYSQSSAREDYFGRFADEDIDATEESEDSETDAVASIPSVPWTLDDFEGCSQEEILDYILENPQDTAGMIVDYLR